jgi:pimeloyl-ACP methyl ester carboxylesterase
MMTPSAWQSGGSYFSHRGQRIFFRVSGESTLPALLLIHGFPTASWDWEALWQPLSAQFQLIALDMMGFGFSAKPINYPYSILDQADSCEALLRNLGVKQYHVLAHDYGDTVAQELLARQSDHGLRQPGMLSLCLLNGGLFPETHRALLVQRLLAGPAGPLLSRAMTRAAFTRSMTRAFGSTTPPSKTLIAGFWELINHQQGRRVMPKLIGYMTERRQHRERWVGALQQSKLPLQLIVGCADPISGEHMAQRFEALVPDKKVLRLPLIGHYPQIEDSESVLAGFQAFQSVVQQTTATRRTQS